MEIHQPSSPHACKNRNVAARYNEIRQSITHLEGPVGEAVDEAGDWGHGVANWGHIMGEYHAGYYSYLL
jgi:metallopeptidase MepB